MNITDQILGDATLNNIKVQVNIRESVDSLCRDGADRTRPFSKIEWLRTPKRGKRGSYKPFWTHTRTLRVILYPLRHSKYVKYTATMTYRSCIVIHLCGSVNSELQTIYVYGYIIISCSLCTTRVITILFL